MKLPKSQNAWEQRKFSDIYKKSSEKNDLSFSKDKVISVANNKWGTAPKNSTDKYMRTYYVYRIGDIAFEGNKSKKFKFGRFVENTLANGIVSHVFDIYRPTQKEHDLWFWKYYIHNENIMRNILRKSTTKATETTTEAKSVDLDLTKLSSTLVYSEVYNMLITPDDYKGKIIKMKGQFNQYTDEETGKIHNAVIIPDATACCQQGLEFELSDKTNPNFEQNTEITVVGTFDTYSDGKFLYCHLKNAKIIDE